MQRDQWCAAAPFRDRALWAGLGQALDEDWTRAHLEMRLPEAVAAAPTRRVRPRPA